MEIWKDIEGFEGTYQVSNLGQVRSLPRAVKAGFGSFRFDNGRILQLIVNRAGYLYVNLGRKKQYVHQLVAKAFLRWVDGCSVDHIDGCKSNNKADNLEIVTILENNLRMWRRIKGKRGVDFHRGKWRAAIRCNNTYITVGRFSDKEEAYQAYYDKYIEIHKVAPW